MWESLINIYHTISDDIVTKEIDGNIIVEVKKQLGIDINKDELIKAINYDRNQYEKGYQDGLNADRWISCCERQPKKSGNYWCTFGGTNIAGIDHYTTESDAKEIFDDPEGYDPEDYEYAGWRSQNVVAWMPLPESYKAEK